MVLQAYVDDSGNQPQSLFFVLGGFVTQTEKWAEFANDWQDALYKDPRIEYFKFNEAMGLKKQFDKGKGWNVEKVAKKLDALIDIILKYVQVRVRGDNQDERAASIRMRIRRGRADGRRA
jgi:Protein of unknown function (DUF3800)